MHSDLKMLMKSLLELIVKSEVLDKCKTSKQLKSLNLSDKLNLLSLKQVRLGFGAEKIISQLIKEDLVSSAQLQQFRKEAQNFVVAMVTKLISKIPLGAKILVYGSVFDPLLVKDKPKSDLLSKFKSLLQYLMELGVLSPDCCDRAMVEFGNFIDLKTRNFEEKLTTFVDGKQRLDELYFKELNVSKYKEVSFVLRILLTLSHGQGAVERGFSVNENVLQPNMDPLTITSKRCVKDHMICNNLLPHSMPLDRDLILSVKASRQKYEMYLIEQKKNKLQNDKKQQETVLSKEIETLTVKCKQKQKAVKMMESDFVECMKKAEEKNDMSYVIKANALKRKSDDIKAEIQSLEKEISVLEDKHKQLQ